MLTPLGAFKLIISERDRINRSEFSLYFIYSMFINIILFVLFLLMTINNIHLYFNTLIYAILIIFYIINAILQITAVIKRGHDLGISGFIIAPLCILASIIVIIPLMLVPGTKKANSYGPSLLDSAEL